MVSHKAISDYIQFGIERDMNTKKTRKPIPNACSKQFENDYLQNPKYSENDYLLPPKNVENNYLLPPKGPQNS